MPLFKRNNHMPLPIKFITGYLMIIVIGYILITLLYLSQSVDVLIKTDLLSAESTPEIGRCIVSAIFLVTGFVAAYSVWLLAHRRRSATLAIIIMSLFSYGTYELATYYVGPSTIDTILFNMPFMIVDIAVLTYLFQSKTVAHYLNK